MSRQTPNDQARTILTNAHVLATLIDPALTNLHQSTAGHPEHTPGAAPAQPAPTTECKHRDCNHTNPCPVHDPDATVKLTATERLATTPDKAQHDLERLIFHLETANKHAARAAALVHRWGLAGIDDTTVQQTLNTVRREIWCENCSKHGHKNPRLEDRTECDYCADFRRTYKRPAPKEILAIRAFRNVYPQDEQRVLNQIDPNWRKKLKNGKAA